MLFKGPAGFQRIIYIIMNIVIGIVVSLCLMIGVMQVPVTADGLLKSVVLSFFIGYTVSDLIPAMNWGNALAAALKVRNPLGAHFISSAVLAFFMGTFILFFCAYINIYDLAGMPGVIGFFISAFWLVLLAAYVSILVFVPLGGKVATAISGFDPAKGANPAVEV